MDTSTSEKLASIVKSVEALPREAQELVVAEFEDRLAEFSATSMSAAQRSEIMRRLSAPRQHAAGDDVHKVLSAYSRNL
jgi:uncharacterized protein with PIN domain